MPFITEELWQRLPKREGEAESIMIAAYPQSQQAWIDAGVEADVEYLRSCVSRARGLRSGANLCTQEDSCAIFIILVEGH